MCRASGESGASRASWWHDVSKVVLDVIVVLVIVCIGGFFSASEMALVSLREGQIRALAKRGRRGQRTARLA